MDLIICRNVLLYFARARIPRVIQRFHRALIDGGQLVLGSVDACQFTFPDFTPVPAPGVALYRKNCGVRNAECKIRNPQCDDA
jgi:chemotaxis protein methyltransferase CheR